MVQVGFHASHEQMPPSALLEAVKCAEKAGFDAAMCSDHFAPWSARQGQSGYAWSWLGAALEATSFDLGVVTAPGQRYHPAIVAQSIATLAEMYPGRFWAALGSGEASNEHITGDRWPNKTERDTRLLECVDVIRALLAGDEVDHRGSIAVDRARLWTRPSIAPQLFGAAVSAQTARVVGGWADGLITINQPLDTMRDVIGAFREGGGESKPVCVQVHLSWAPTEAEAEAIAVDQWQSNVFDSSIAWNLEMPQQFDALAKHVGVDEIRSCVLVSADPAVHAHALLELCELGIDRIYLHHVGQEQSAFIECFAERVLPELPAMSSPRDSDLWWKNAVIYCLDVETYLDSDGDGIGDLPGLVRRIDYLAGMGVSCLWLMPFHPSPNRDDGYDITDYYAVDDKLGTLGDFVDLIRAAKDRGLRVLIDLVVNHTSDRHPWFKSARSSPTSRYRDFYVWRDEPPSAPKAEVVFPDAETSIWAWDEKAGQYYLHHFYSHQPDLNIANPEVRDEIGRIASFWLQLGVDGFRVDAVPFLLESGGIKDAPDLDPHLLLKDIRSVVSRRNGEAALLGEVNLKPKDLVGFFGDEPGDEIQLLFDFNVMQAMYLAFARCDAKPLIDAFAKQPPIPGQCQWANFLRNHDELTLDKLTEAQRQEVFAAFGPDEDMQLFGRGLRRRLPSMFGGDQARLRMAYSLMFSLPGAPVLFYGEEIGMGENLDIAGRMSVRTPMQWTGQTNAGFSTARPSKLRRPLPSGRFGPLGVNVEEQRRDDGSLLNWMERMIRRRRETPELGWGEMTILPTDSPSVMAHLVAGEGRSILLVHNLAPEPCELRLALPVDRGGEIPTIVDLLNLGHDLELDRRGAVEFVVGGYGHHWFAVEEPGHQRTP